MPAKRLPLPDKARLLELAAEHPSLSSIARAIGWNSSSFNERLKREGWHAEIAAALADKAAPYPIEEVSETDVLRQRVAELERAHRAQRKVDTFEERALAVFAEAIEAREPVYSPKAIPKRKPAEHEFVLLWSDTHAGEVVSEVETNGINSYDWEIMLARHERIREAVFSFADHRPYPVSRLHVCALGDMLSGEIHDELVETNEVPLAEATIQFALDGSVWLESFLERFSEVRVSGVVGNHPRARKKPQAKHAFNNADWLAYHAMAANLRKQDAISFDIPKASAHPVEVCGRRCLLWHGDSVRSSMPGVPWGGVMRRSSALSNQYAAKGQALDHFFVGHFHQGNMVDQGRLLMNGSVKGPDEYSLRAFGGGSAPCQLLATFHPERGLTDVSLIDCS